MNNLHLQLAQDNLNHPLNPLCRGKLPTKSLQQLNTQLQIFNGFTRLQHLRQIVRLCCCRIHQGKRCIKQDGEIEPIVREPLLSMHGRGLSDSHTGCFGKNSELSEIERLAERRWTIEHDYMGIIIKVEPVGAQMRNLGLQIR